MDFAQIRAVVEVARLQSFSRAAEALGLTQPAISAQVRAVEDECGFRLFDRLGRNVYLTQPGAVLADYGRRLIQYRREAVRALTDLHSAPSGRILLGATEAICTYVLPAIVKEFQRQHPNVAVSIFRHNTNRVIRKLTDGVLDAGFISLPIGADDVQVTPIFRDRWMAAVAPSHPLANAAKLRMEDLLPYPFILPESGHTREVMDHLLAPHRRQAKIAFEVSGIEVIKRFTAEGMGVTLLSEIFAADDVAAGRLKLIPLSGQKLSREIGLAVRKNDYQSQAVKALIGVARKVRVGKKRT